jgi:SAM-dependent methyltransferase
MSLDPVRLLALIVDVAGRASPRLKRRVWRLWYDRLATLGPAEPWVFMNFGFAALDPRAPALRLASDDEPHRVYIQLYDRVTESVDLTSARVLEVGCGRGGGCLYLLRYRGPRAVVGVDVSGRAIAFCRRRHRAAGLAFLQADAESLPFGDGSFDAVVNVESSHCYGSMDRFLAEVRRVLRVDGSFLFADLRDRREGRRLREHLRASGLELQTEEVITPHVVLSLERDHDRKLALIRQAVPPLLRRPVRHFAGTRGSRMDRALRDGRAEYLRWVLRKDAAPQRR